MKKLVYILFFIGLMGNLSGQYTFLYRQYVLNQLGLNPAYTGSREVFSTALQYRNQWTGSIVGAPVTQTISADTPLKNNRVALGLYLINEKIGATRNTNIEFNYAYRIQFNTGKLSLGLKGALNTFTHQMINTNNPADIAFNEGNNTYFLPNFGVGIYYYNYNRFFIGASVPFLLSYKSASANNGYQIDTDFNAYNFLLSSGLLFTYNDNFKFRLSGMAEYNRVSSFDFDVNAMFIIKEQLWAGVSYYTTNMLTFIMQYQLNPQMKIGYSYDHNIGKINVLNGSHEILIRYEFSYKIDAFNPRYF